MELKPIASSAMHRVLSTYELLEMILLHLNTGRHLIDLILRCKLVNKAFFDVVTKSGHICRLFGQHIPSFEQASSLKHRIKVPDHPISRSIEVYIRGLPCDLPAYFKRQPQVQILFDGSDREEEYRAILFWRVYGTALNHASRDEVGCWRKFLFGTAKTMKVAVRVWHRRTWRNNPRIEVNAIEEFNRPVMLGDLIDVGRRMILQTRGTWLAWAVDFEQVVNAEGQAV
ncbi:hypothetical protein AC578_2478 [Pseudocercospora eumusae]|uniref:Uncharacterized protein n=1 Tax=Pseudocercospora eumusae TaxID=321146 RepID=A0A139HXH9_9PEZI|nr:hypothetical protein AC578_2478 [Pseudocercospora eumusae]